MDLEWYEKQIEQLRESDDLVEVGQIVNVIKARTSMDHDFLDELFGMVVTELIRRGLEPVQITHMVGLSTSGISRAKKQWFDILERLQDYPLPEPVDQMSAGEVMAHYAKTYHEERAKDPALNSEQRRTSAHRARLYGKLTARSVMQSVMALPFIPAILLLKKAGFGGAAGGTAAGAAAGTSTAVALPAVAAGATGFVGMISSGVAAVTGVVATVPQIVAGTALTVAAVAAPITASQVPPAAPDPIAYQIVTDTRPTEGLGPLFSGESPTPELTPVVETPIGVPETNEPTITDRPSTTSPSSTPTQSVATPTPKPREVSGPTAEATKSAAVNTPTPTQDVTPATDSTITQAPTETPATMPSPTVAMSATLSPTTPSPDTPGTPTPSPSPTPSLTDDSDSGGNDAQTMAERVVDAIAFWRSY